VHDTLKNQEWVSPSLNTTADGSLYLTVLDLAKWAVNLNHPGVPSAESLAASWTPIRLNDGGSYPYGFAWSVDRQRGYLRIGHGGSWQGFRTSIQRYPDFTLTVIALANLAQARPEALTAGIAGILEPALTPPHLLAAPLPGPAPRLDIAQTLRRVLVVRDTTLLTAGFARFLRGERDASAGEAVAAIRDWVFLGCDLLGARAYERLGSAVERVCYAKGTSPRGGVAVQLLYANAERIADLQVYAF
jgi:hypothetical protein